MSEREGARKSGSFLAVSISPDMCKTPPTNAPIPYTVTADLDGSLAVSPNVFYGDCPVVLVDQSSIDKVTGDEAGSGGGVKSGCNVGEVKFFEGDETVLVNGKRVLRQEDTVEMNGGNTQGKVIWMMGTEPAGGVDEEGRPTQDPNPPYEAGDGVKGG